MSAVRRAVATRRVIALLTCAIDECDATDPAMRERIEKLQAERTSMLNPSAAAPRARRAARSDISWADLLRGRVHSSRRGGGAAPPVYDDDSGDDGGPKVAFVAPR